MSVEITIQLSQNLADRYQKALVLKQSVARQAFDQAIQHGEILIRSHAQTRINPPRGIRHTGASVPCTRPGHGG